MPFPPFNYLLPPRVLRDSRVMVFHGDPKMEEAMAGYRRKWYRAAKPAGWLKDFWLQERG